MNPVARIRPRFVQSIQKIRREYQMRNLFISEQSARREGMKEIERLNRAGRKTTFRIIPKTIQSRIGADRGYLVQIQTPAPYFI